MTQQGPGDEQGSGIGRFFGLFAPTFSAQLLPVTITLGVTLVISIVALVLAGTGDGSTVVQGAPNGPDIQGSQGLTGAQGSQGDQGIQGVPGATGAPGSQGSQGAKGEPGVQGIPGETGEKGDRGPVGIPGPEGEKGEPGAEGIKGDTGEQGLPGLSDWIMVTDKSQVNNLPSKRLSVKCPVATVLLTGGGWTYGTIRPPITISQADAQYPTTPKSWLVIAETDDLAADWWLTAYVICAAP